MKMPNCREVSTAYARGDYAGASLLVRLGAGLHLLLCRQCRRFQRQLGLIESALKSSVFPVPDEARVAALRGAALARLRGL